MECSVPPVSGGWCTTISVFDLTRNEVDGKGGGRDGYLPPFSTSLQCTPADPRTAATTVIGSQLSLPLLGPSPFEITLSHRNHGPSAYIQNRKGRKIDIVNNMARRTIFKGLAARVAVCSTVCEPRSVMDIDSYVWWGEDLFDIRRPFPPTKFLSFKKEEKMASGLLEHTPAKIVEGNRCRPK